MNFVFIKKCITQCAYGCCHDRLVYPVKRSGKITLRYVDENGYDGLFDSNIMGYADTRVYASGNSKYLGLLTSNDNSISRFEMYPIETNIYYSMYLHTGRLFVRQP